MFSYDYRYTRFRVTTIMGPGAAIFEHLLPNYVLPSP